jgi:hypothetical protein
VLWALVDQRARQTTSIRCSPTSAPTDRLEFAQPGLHVGQLELAQPGLYVGQLVGLHVGQLSFALCAVRELKKGEVRKRNASSGFS